MQDQQKRGTLAGILCYTIWGLYPFYWRLLDNCASQEIIAHRIIWCFATTVLVCALTRTDFVALLRDARARRFLLPAAAIITVNWSVYIWAVMVGHVVEAAIGYYINPLVSILFGVVFFKEKLTRLQLVAVVLCAAGVVYYTVDYGQFPWISLVLAFSFGAYGAIKKRAGYPALQALATENTFMVVPAIVFSVALAVTTGENHFFADVATFDGWKTTALLLIAGPVTAVPLILFAKAANDIPLSMLGFIQYISPTLVLISGVFFLGETFTFQHGVLLACIWTGIALVSIETLRTARK